MPVYTSGKFRLDASVQFSDNDSPLGSPSQSDDSDMSPPKLYYSDYDSDIISAYPLAWQSLEDMQMWLKGEEETKFIELRLKEKRPNLLEEKGWTERYVYVCARQGTGGKKQYQKKFPERGRKVPTKRCGCDCRLIVRCYPNTLKVLGNYNAIHSHPIGNDNAKFTRLTTETRVQIAEMLRIGITHDQIVRMTCHSCLLSSY